MFRIIEEDDYCTECSCGASVFEGDEVEFIGGNPFSSVCDTCPSCIDEVEEAGSRAGEINY